MAKKRVAVLVGCNYANTPHKLHGCINDVLAMRDTLVARFGFDPSHVELLTDGPDSPIQPTGKNIKSVLRRVIDGAGPGAVLFFHYSGHGTRIPSVKPGHPFRQDEAIVPCDFNLITDVDFRDLVNRLQNEASFTMLSDSCHSGGLIDKEKEQIGPASADRGGSPLIQRQRTISFDSIMVHLSSLSGISSAHIGDHLSHLFGDEASPKLRKNEAALPMRRDKGILLSGCQANETSADMDPSMGGGKSFGAFSYAVETVLKSHAGALSNRELVSRARQVLMKQGFEQHPCLYCSDENADAPFLCQQAH
ncbi:metacaspase-9 [Aristolochia californica]|uniref:metacaspase-9 n=1 Tax=Aristolochia californica TaxID=171875 RepID=UPI0035D769BC